MYGITTMPYHFQGNYIYIPPGAEVSEAFLPQTVGGFREELQLALNEIEPWQDQAHIVKSFKLSRMISTRVVKLEFLEAPLWGVNPHHKAKNPGLSPYVVIDNFDGRQGTNRATLELVGEVERPSLIRAYPGDYLPPLPWMVSAETSPAGLDGCIDYWNSHAFIYRTSGPELTYEAPEWYRQTKVN